MALTDRQEILAKILRESPHLIESRSVSGRDTAVLRGAILQGLERFGRRYR